MRTLFAVLGRTPQTLTEALYGLWRESLFPDRLVVLTTSEGKDIATKTLLGRNGAIASLLDCCDLPGRPALPEMSILAVATPTGDIETAQDASAFLDMCMNAVRQESLAGGQLLFSIAGGRKTMSVALATAAHCFGREGDMLFHVLVPSAFENSTFFYPKPGTESEEAPVSIVPAPLFHLRDFLPKSILEAPSPASALPERLHAGMRVEISLQRRTLRWKEQTVQLPPVLLAVMLFFLARRDCPADAGVRCPEDCSQCAISASGVQEEADAFARCYNLVAGNSPPRGGQGIMHLSRGNFFGYRSRLSSLLETHFGPSGCLLGIQRIGRRRQALYCLRLPQAATLLSEDEATILRDLSAGRDAGTKQE